LRAALDLFREEGFDKTRMEDIAARALVSIPTVYNYFASKREVLIEILQEDRNQANESFEHLASTPPAEPSAGFAALVYANMRDIRDPKDKQLWRELIAAVAKSHDRERDPFEKNQDVFRHYIKRLLQHYVATGKIDRKLPLDLTVDVILAVNSHNLRFLVASESCTPEDVRVLTRRQIKMILLGWQRAAPASDAVSRRSSSQPEA
jgi:AcrR family transcriptional regulator